MGVSGTTSKSARALGKGDVLKPNRLKRFGRVLGVSGTTSQSARALGRGDVLKPNRLKRFG